jgi:cytochrome P450
MPSAGANAGFDDYLDSTEFYNDPYPIYSLLRDDAPIYWSELWNAWVLTRYADVLAIVRDPARFSNGMRVPAYLDQLPDSERGRFRLLEEHFAVQIPHSDPTYHTRLRTLITKAFTARMVAALHNRIQELVDDLLDGVEEQGRMDVIWDFAFPLPAAVIGEIVGMPAEDIDQYKEWSSNIMGFLGVTPPDPDYIAGAQQSIVELKEYVRGQIEQRRQRPHADLLSQLVEVEEQGDRLNEEEIFAIVAVLMSAGHETTTNTIGNGLVALLRNPDMLARLQQEPDLIESAVEEILRYDGTTQRHMRVAVEDVEMGGHQIGRHQLVFAMGGAANRDPAQFPDPDRFDITRRNNRHVTFGHGIHFCVGAPLARLETKIAINTLLRRLPRLQLTTEELEWHQHIGLRGLKTLPVLF